MARQYSIMKVPAEGKTFLIEKGRTSQNAEGWYKRIAGELINGKWICSIFKGTYRACGTILNDRDGLVEHIRRQHGDWFKDHVE